jgi:hypothetical protein
MDQYEERVELKNIVIKGTDRGTDESDVLCWRKGQGKGRRLTSWIPGTARDQHMFPNLY